MTKITKAKAKIVELNRLLTCPYCKKDLRKTGFRTNEDAIVSFDWKFSKEKGYFKSTQYDIRTNGENIIAWCNNCAKEIEWSDLNKTKLV